MLVASTARIVASYTYRLKFIYLRFHNPVALCNLLIFTVAFGVCCVLGYSAEIVLLKKFMKLHVSALNLISLKR